MTLNYSYTNSRNVALLRNIVYGEENPVANPPQSNIEAILTAILNEEEYSGTADEKERMEKILIAISKGEDIDIATMPPISRNEKILLYKMNNLEYADAPQSQIEEILINWDIYSGKTKNALIWASGEATGTLVWANADGTETGALIYADEGDSEDEEE